MTARAAARQKALADAPDALRLGGEDDAEPRLSAGDPAVIRRRFDDQGYVVVQALLPAALCERVRTAFAAEVKPYPGPLYRQTSAHPERHVLTERGYVLNPLLNVQSSIKSCSRAFAPPRWRF